MFELRLPFAKPTIFLAGTETDHRVHRHGRMHLKAGGYFADFEKLYGAHGVLPSLDGGDRFRLRKAMGPAFSRGRLSGRLDEVYRLARRYMAGWKVGEMLPVRDCRRMIDAQLSPLCLAVDSQDIVDDPMDFKERALATHIVNALPRFMLNTPGMKRRARAVDELLERIQSVHTPGPARRLPAQPGRRLAEPARQRAPARAGGESAFRPVGDALSFAVYAMASQPELYERIRAEADALFANGDPQGDDFNRSSMDVTHRFLMECLRMDPIVPMSMRDVMNTFVIDGYEIPVGSRVHIAQTAPHYMDDVFPAPFSFDIDRYLPPRDEHRGPGYAPYGLGTHRCLGSRWMDLQLAVNVPMIAHYFTLQAFPARHVESLRHRPLPSMSPHPEQGPYRGARLRRGRTGPTAPV